MSRHKHEFIDDSLASPPRPASSVLARHRSLESEDIGAQAIGASALGASAIGAVAIGAFAIGALAIGAVAIGRLAIGRARIRRLEIDELVVRSVHVTEELQGPDRFEADKEPAMSMENKALVRRWFEEVWTQGRVAAIDEMLAADGLIHGLGVDMRGPAEFKQFHTAYRGAFPDIWLQVDDIMAEGDMVAARWSGGGTHGGAGLGFAQTNRAVTFQGMTFARVRDGQIVEGWNSFDELGLLKQIGAVDVKAAG